MGRHDASHTPPPALAVPQSPADELAAHPVHYWRQVDRVLAFLTYRAGAPDLLRRAVNILRAQPASPHLEQMAGGKAADDMLGQQVRCSGPCMRTYTASPEDPWLNAATQPDGTVTGGCAGCLAMPQSRTDEAVPVLTGAVVTGAGTLTGKARKAAPTGGTDDDDSPGSS